MGFDHGLADPVSVTGGQLHVAFTHVLCHAIQNQADVP